jgi:hypothetical protein
MKEKSNGNLNYTAKIAAERAAVSTEKTEATICKIRKEANVIRSGKEKLKLRGKKRKPSYKRMGGPMNLIYAQ